MNNFAIILALTAALEGADIKSATARGASDKMEIIATVYPSKELVKEKIGDDMGGFIYVMEIKIKPRVDEPIRIDRDDFQMLTTNDGQKSRPFSPAQLTGRGALMIKSKPGPSSGVMGQNNGPAWGGLGGGPPVMMPGNGTQLGSSTANVDSAHAEMKDEAGAKENPMKKVLEAKEFPQKEITEVTEGLLYFPIEGKHKPKNIMLLYRGTGGRIDIEFK